MSPNNIREMLHGKQRPYIRPIGRPRAPRTDPMPVNLLKVQIAAIQAVEVGDHKEILKVRYSDTARAGWVRCSWMGVTLAALRRTIAKDIWVDPTSLADIALVDDPPTRAWGHSMPSDARRHEPVVEVTLADLADYGWAKQALTAEWRRKAGYQP